MRGWHTRGVVWYRGGRAGGPAAGALFPAGSAAVVSAPHGMSAAKSLARRHWQTRADRSMSSAGWCDQTVVVVVIPANITRVRDAQAMQLVQQYAKEAQVFFYATHSSVYCDRTRGARCRSAAPWRVSADDRSACEGRPGRGPALRPARQGGRVLAGTHVYALNRPRDRPAWHGQRVCGAHPPALPRAAAEGAVSGAQRCSAAQRPRSRSPLHARSGVEHRAPLTE